MVAYISTTAFLAKILIKTLSYAFISNGLFNEKSTFIRLLQ